MNDNSHSSVEDMIKELSKSSLNKFDWEIMYELCVRSYNSKHNSFEDSDVCKCIKEKIQYKIEETMALFSERS